ncbi:hypothetical protein [uncultured Thermanaerothrix sp.]|uniref:SRPBCC family protein n=1 Tax=uncultured Thermanaerothrix sp. TaxID=1195149 RepID=UPI00261D4248|nr:hypothetical protein [uncultured Thermanaerothrix sp.]
MPEFRTRYIVKAPLAAVADFHWQEQALARLTPPPLRLEVLMREPLAEGSRLRFRLQLGPLTVRWEARHIDVDPQRGFTDEQVEGPLLTWRHRHAFLPLADGHTLIEEEVSYTYKTGWRHAWTRVVFAPLGLRFLFAYRRWAMKQALERR